MNTNSNLTSNATSLFRGSSLSQKSRRLNDFDDIPPWRFLSFGWKWAIDVLLKEAKTGVCSSDCCYPVLYVFRQYLEIKLKELIITLELSLHSKKIGEDELKAQYGHNIKKLWDYCDKLLMEWLSNLESEKDYSECNSRNLEDFKRVKLYINEIYEKDPQSFAYRYPQIAEKYTVDLNHFYENAMWVSEYLEGVSDWIETIQDLENECCANFDDEY
ncbi:hypothetical protein [Methanoregula sp.]|uniref:hypothetical protein n=1 Tax=Methanoregula sp. TaxID=2052170 RepID=UPI0035633215